MQAPGRYRALLPSVNSMRTNFVTGVAETARTGYSMPRILTTSPGTMSWAHL